MELGARLEMIRTIAEDFEARRRKRRMEVDEPIPRNGVSCAYTAVPHSERDLDHGCE